MNVALAPVVHETVTYSTVTRRGELVMITRTFYNLRPHGTSAAYERHRKRGQPACAACREWSRQDVARDRAMGKPRGGNGFG